jgi:hypothetical protein
MGYKLRAAGNAAAAAAAAAALHVQTTKGNVLLIPHVFSAGTLFSGSVSPAAWHWQASPTDSSPDCNQPHWHRLQVSVSFSSSISLA